MSSASAERVPLLSRVFVFASAAHFLHGLAVHAYLHLPGFLKNIGASQVEIGVMASTLAITAIACRPFLGRAMDVRGRRPVIIASGVLHVLVCLSYLTVHSIGPWVYFIRAVHGVATAMIFSALFTYAADIVPEKRRTEGIALFGVSGLLPIAIGSLIGDAVLAFVDYRELFYITVGFAACGLLLSFPLEEPRRAEHVDPSRGFFSAAFQKNLMPLWFIGTAFATSLSAVFIFLKIFVLDTGIGSVGLFMGAYAFSAALLRVFFGWIPDRFGPKRALVPAIGALVIGLVQLAFANSTTDIIVSGVLCGLGHGFAFPIIAGLVVNRSGSGDRGSALSLFTAVFDAGFLVGGPLFGALIESASYQTTYLVAAAIAVGGIAVFTVWDHVIDA